MTKQWYALRTKPHKERSVEQLLLSKDIEAFLPLLHIKPVNPRSKKWKPFFPGYLFIYSTPEEMMEKQIKWVQGTLGLVLYGEIPAIVPDEFIKALTDQLSKIQVAGGYSKNFDIGDRVRITSGPLEGYDAIFDVALDSKDRVQVLLSLMGSHTQKIQLDASSLKKL